MHGSESTRNIVLGFSLESEQAVDPVASRRSSQEAVREPAAVSQDEISRKRIPLTLGGNWRKGAIVLFAALLVFQLTLPWWPLNPTATENDALRISFGAAQQVYDYAPHLPYRYESQSGTYQAVAWLTWLSNFKIEPLVGFRLLTMLSYLCFAFTATQLLHNLLSYPKWFCFLSLCLFQETFIASYFPNSNMLALPWGTTALLIVSQRSSWQRSCIAGVLYGIGIWMRFDLILICLAFPVIMMPSSWREWGHASLVAGISALVSLGLLGSCGITLGSIVTSYREHTDHFYNPLNTLAMYATLFTALLAVSTCCGLFRMWQSRHWKLLGLTIAGVLPSVLAFGFTVTTPKYLLYSLVFVAIASSLGLRWLMNSAGRVGKVSVGLLFLLQYLVNPFCITQWSEKQFTHDGQRRLGSIYLAPKEWHHWNRQSSLAVKRIDRFMLNWAAKNKTSTVVLQNYTLGSLAPYELLMCGYRLKNAVPGQQIEIFNYHKDGQEITLINIDPSREASVGPGEIEELGITVPPRLLVLGTLQPGVFPVGEKLKSWGKGRFGSYIAESSLHRTKLRK